MEQPLIKEKPLALALIICDQIIVEEKTGKKTLIGIFNQIKVRQLPAVHRRMVVFVSVTGGRGDYDAKLRLSRDDQSNPEFELDAKITIPQPISVVEISFILENLHFTATGLYRFEFLCDDELIFSRMVAVESIQNPIL